MCASQLCSQLCLNSDLVNGRLSEKIVHQRGLRQGDPISPLLFANVMDCLAACLAEAESCNILMPIGRQTLTFHASLYADDVALVINPNLVEMLSVRHIFRLFGLASGLHTNLAKSSCMPIRCDDINLDGKFSGDLSWDAAFHP